MKYISICNQINQLNHYIALQSNNKLVNFTEHCMEIQADILLQDMYGSSIWGYLKDNNNSPISYQKVILVKRCIDILTKREHFEIVAQTCTDEVGSYMFEIYVEENTDLYIIVDTQEINGEELVNVKVSKHENREYVNNNLKVTEYMKKKEEAYRTCTNYVKFSG